jgi:hypothetical protein
MNCSVLNFLSEDASEASETMTETIPTETIENFPEIHQPFQIFPKLLEKSKISEIRQPAPQLIKNTKSSFEYDSEEKRYILKSLQTPPKNFDSFTANPRLLNERGMPSILSGIIEQRKQLAISRKYALPPVTHQNYSSRSTSWGCRSSTDGIASESMNTRRDQLVIETCDRKDFVWCVHVLLKEKYKSLMKKKLFRNKNKIRLNLYRVRSLQNINKDLQEFSELPYINIIEMSIPTRIAETSGINANCPNGGFPLFMSLEKEFQVQIAMHYFTNRGYKLNKMRCR